MLEYYLNLKERIQKTPPNFNLNIEEVCELKPKEPYTLLTIKDRSKTFCGNFEFKSSLNEKIVLPKNNPLHDIKNSASQNAKPLK